MVAGFGWVALLAHPGLFYAALVVPFVMTSVGGSPAMAPVSAAVLGSVAPGEVGTASGVSSMVRELAGVLGLAVMVAAFTGSGGGYASAGTFVDGLGPAVWVGTVLVASGAVGAALLPGTARKPAPPAPSARPPRPPLRGPVADPQPGGRGLSREREPGGPIPAEALVGRVGSAAGRCESAGRGELGSMGLVTGGL